MRVLFLALLAAYGCGSGGGSGGGDASFGADKGGAKPGETTAPPTTTTADPASTPSYHSMLVQDAAALPACVPAAEGWLVYVKANEAFQVCTAGAWVDVDIKGEQGEAGEAGEAGKDGKDGKDGSDNRIVSSISCGGILEGTSINVRYSAAVLSSGDVFVTGAVEVADTSGSGTAFYSAEQNGASVGGVIITFDLLGDANSGFWILTLDRSSLVVTADYNDVDGDNSWSMQPDACTVNEY